MSLVLVDTSVWISHLRASNETLISLLENGRAATHSAVIGELACGSLRNRSTFLETIGRLRSVTEADSEEALEMISRHKLFGKAIGWVDAQLLASCLVSGAGLFTLDRKLGKIADQLL